VQYSKERHSEEEYAFKSAISVSLEPYRDLLRKMREDKATETDFVQKLMQEVFTNPVEHIYRNSNPKDSVINKLQVIEIIKEIIGNIENIKKIDDFISGKTELINLLKKFIGLLKPETQKLIQ
jgi:Asp-tRNA(Asn)/Glu-tRNA(Gln) amidotransferase C subunit